MLIVDLSSNQGSVDFPRLKRAGVGAVWMKVSEGATWDDPDWTVRAAQARKAGLRVGGYHFARPDRNNSVTEAEHFAEKLGKVGRRDLRPVLDFETHPGIVGWTRTFNSVFKKKTGLTPIFYSYPAFVQEMNPAKTIGDGLWLASYSRNDGMEHPFVIPKPWKHIVAHQFTSNATVAGVPSKVDLSHAPRVRGVLAHPVAGLI